MKQARFVLIASALFLAGLYAWGSPLLLVVEHAPSDGFVTKHVDAALAEGAKGAPRASLDAKGQRSALAVQYDAEESGGGRLTVLLPVDVLPGARIELDFSNANAEKPGLAQQVSVKEEDGRVTVDNGHVQVVHDPRVQAGLPARVTFAATGKTFEGHLLNDRLYDKAAGQFFLRADPAAHVRVLSRGPLEAVVEVEARYLAGTNAPASKPRAVYRFRYRAGSPAIEVTAHSTQETRHTWPEYHLMEWNFPSKGLPQWAFGEPRQAGQFKEGDTTLLGGSWGCLSDGTHVFGILGGATRLYPGSGGYGSYVHGPWLQWEGVDMEARCVLWLSAQPAAVDTLSARANAASIPAVVRLTTGEIEALRAEVESGLAGMAPGHARGLYRWRLSLITTDGRRSAPLERTKDRLVELKEAIAKSGQDGQPAPPFLFARGAALSNEKIGCLLTPPAEGQTLRSIFAFDTEREFLSETPAPLWELEVEDRAGRVQRWTNLDGPFEAEALALDGKVHASATLVWVGKGEAEHIRVIVPLQLEAARLRLGLKVENDSETLSIGATTFPKLLLRPIGESPEDDTFLTPTVSGTAWPAPLRRGVQCNAYYPGGWGTMQFGAHYDADAGVYVAAHDPVASFKRYRVDARGEQQALDVRVEWPAPDASVPGNDVALPGEVVVEAFRGDWFDAAQIYRAWAEQNAQWWPQREEWARTDTPKWMREVCIWGRPYGSFEQAVPPTKRFAEYMAGLPMAVHWYSWHEIPFDNNYPHYFPAKPGFAEGVKAMQEAGVRVMPYINGRLWDMDTEDFKTTALPAATKKRDGQPYVEHYGSNPEDLVPMCPTQPVWQEKVKEIVLRLVGPECNVDGVYIDQVAAASPVECYDASHGHPLRGGHWWTTDGYWPMLTALNREIDEKHPEKMLTTECNAEPFTHVFDGYLTWNFQYDNAVPAFAAVYGGKVQVFGRAYNGNDTQAHWCRTGQALVWGEQLGWASIDIIDTDPAAAEYLRRCARMRHRLLPYLAEGRMARPPQVSGNIPDITSDWAWSGKWPVTVSALQRGAWQAADGSMAVVFANTTDKALAFTWEFDAARCGLDAGTYAVERIEEEARSPEDSVADRFTRELTLPPLSVEAYVLRAVP